MKRIITLGLVAAFIAMGAGLALSKAVKLQLVPFPFETVGSTASGHAILNYAKGAETTEVQVNCWGLMPETEYLVYFANVLYGSYTYLGTFKTMKNGNGNFHIKWEGDISTKVIAINTGGGTVLHSI